MRLVSFYVSGAYRIPLFDYFRSGTARNPCKEIGMGM